MADGREYYYQAVEATTALGYRPELALIRLGLAELLLDHYPDERPEAIEHLGFAISQFREMNMRPSLEYALARRHSLEN